MKRILIGAKYAEVLQNSIKKLGFLPQYVPDNPKLDNRLSGHADLSVLYAGGERLIVSNALGGQFIKELQALGYQVFVDETELGSRYPMDCALNICFTGEYFIYNPRTASKFAVDILLKSGYKPIEVKQGYANCSVCVVNESSVITADAGIAGAAAKHGLDVLLIEPGYVNLEGFEYGFIGGSAFRIDYQTIAFTGRLDGHPSRDRILEFIKSHGFSPIFLSDRDIFDIGGAVIL